MNAGQKERLVSLAAHMNKIEGRLKAAENVRQEVVIAGINELRYAGRRFVDAWALLESGKTGPDAEKEIDDHFVIAKHIWLMPITTSLTQSASMSMARSAAFRRSTAPRSL